MKIKSSRRFALETDNELWQKGFFEHVLRSGESIEPFAWYIWLNPVRRGLVATPEAYPCGGSLSGMKMPSTWTDKSWRPNGK